MKWIEEIVNHGSREAYMLGLIENQVNSHIREFEEMSGLKYDGEQFAESKRVGRVASDDNRAGVVCAQIDGIGIRGSICDVSQAFLTPEFKRIVRESRAANDDAPEDQPQRRAKSFAEIKGTIPDGRWAWGKAKDVSMCLCPVWNPGLGIFVTHDQSDDQYRLTVMGREWHGTFKTQEEAMEVGLRDAYEQLLVAMATHHWRDQFLGSPDDK